MSLLSDIFSSHVKFADGASQEANDLVTPGTALELYAAGFTWCEGPLWLKNELLFADVSGNRICTVRKGEEVKTFFEPSGYRGEAPYPGPEPGSSGMTRDARGRITVAGHAGRTVWRFEGAEPTAPLTVLADNYRGLPFNSPNDCVYGPDGSLYFTDPPYGLPTQSNHDPRKELSVNGVYRLREADKLEAQSSPTQYKLDLLITNLRWPNGVAFSPDGKLFYVSDSEIKHWLCYPVNDDGSLGAEAMFFDGSKAEGNGNPDGIKIDREGHVYAAGPGGVWIFDAKGGVLGKILIDQVTSNLAWGDADARTLIVTATDRIYSFRVNVPGFRPFSL